MMVTRQVRLTYPKHLRDQPLLYGLIRNFDVVTNIQQAQVTGDEAWLLLTVHGDPERVQGGLDWLAEQGVLVEHQA